MQPSPPILWAYHTSTYVCYYLLCSDRWWRSGPKPMTSDSSISTEYQRRSCSKLWSPFVAIRIHTVLVNCPQTNPWSYTSSLTPDDSFLNITSLQKVSTSVRRLSSWTLVIRALSDLGFCAHTQSPRGNTDVWTAKTCKLHNRDISLHCYHGMFFLPCQST